MSNVIYCVLIYLYCDVRLQTYSFILLEHIKTMRNDISVQLKQLPIMNRQIGGYIMFCCLKMYYQLFLRHINSHIWYPTIKYTQRILTCACVPIINAHHERC